MANSGQQYSEKLITSAETEDDLSVSVETPPTSDRSGDNKTRYRAALEPFVVIYINSLVWEV